MFRFTAWTFLLILCMSSPSCVATPEDLRLISDILGDVQVQLDDVANKVENQTIQGDTTDALTKEIIKSIDEVRETVKEGRAAATSAAADAERRGEEVNDTLSTGEVAGAGGIGAAAVIAAVKGLALYMESRRRKEDEIEERRAAKVAAKLAKAGGAPPAKDPAG